MNTYKIYEENLDRLQKKVTRIQNKCKKYGCDFHFAITGEEFKKVTDEYGKEHVLRFVVVEAEGTAVVNGWEFVGTIQPSENSNENIIRNALGIEVPKRFYNCNITCEHCKRDHRRNESYIIHNKETNEFKQVGRNCLADFTGGLSAEAAASYISMYDELIVGDSVVGGNWGEPYYETEQILAYAYYRVKYFGYGSSQGINSTKSQVMADYDFDQHVRMPKAKYDEVLEYRMEKKPDFKSEECRTYIENLLNHFKGVEEESDYMHNLKVYANSEYIKYKDLGYVVSMVSTYNKYLQVEDMRKKRAELRKKEAEASSFIGEVGKRITVNTNTAEIMTSWQTDYGYTYRCKFTDANGNVYMWDSSNGGLDPDKSVESITGTVKKHSEYNGIKQTWLTRCKIKYSEKKKEEKHEEYSGPDYAELMDFMAC